MPTNSTNDKLVYPELSYVLMGILFEIHNKLGTKYQEKHYQKAVEIKLKELKIPYQREAKVNIEFNGEELGEFFIDFIIDGKIILELKRIWKITADDIKQVLRYLKATNLKLGIIVNFRHQRLESRRVLN
ncbi:GxxExxY protein [Patescibacteria group bacterium]|nr:GxxExxY protein [Patescibacteria group bacterium]MBU4142577.1 GxxExxY protein [Patescibacteria group bacterium]